MIFTAAIHFILALTIPTAKHSHIFIRTRKKYGESQLLILRRCEQLTKKIQKVRCDLEFLRTCLIYNLTPRFIQLRALNRSFISKEQNLLFKRQCLQQEFNSHYKINNRLESELNSATKGLEKALSQVDFFSATRFLHEIAIKIRNETMANHQRKLTSLNHGPVGQNIDDSEPKLIHNISSHILTESEERLLNRGWEFCIENRITKFLDLQTDIEENITKIQPNCHTTVYHTICKHVFAASQKLMQTTKKKKISNISDNELQALTSLKENKHIIITRADKGNAIVIMNKIDYINRIETILAGNQFAPLPESTSLEKKEKEMNKILRELHNNQIINKSAFWHLHSTSSSLSVLYGQPKVHKTGYPLRPIISTIGSYNYSLLKYLAKLISNHRTEAPPSFIKDSFELVKKLKTITIKPTNTMVSFDLESLYTNVPVKEAIELALDLIYKRPNKPDTLLTRQQTQQLLHQAVCDVPFRFMDRTYIQKDGVAMGNALAPILANLFMVKMEEKLNRFTKNKPKIWLRYVDDVFCLFDIEEKHIKIFLQRINMWHNNLKFTSEFEEVATLPFLDVLIKKGNNSLTTSIYRKKTHTNLYLLWDSNQCRKYKIGLIKTLTIRIQRICSNETIAKAEKRKLEETLKNNGYPTHIIRRGIKAGEAIAKRIQQPQPKIPTVEKQKIFFTIPYFGQESIVFASRIRKICDKMLPHIHLNIAYKKQGTLKQNFLPIQKGHDESKRNKKLIYHIPCQNCEKVYIGETGRSRETRITEHLKAIKKKDINSELVKHILNTNHTMNFNETTTLAKETNWKRRVIKESLLTFESKDKAVNEVKHKLQVFG
ncbi:unnamed protein product [Rotaria magnacalcarata]|uniref:Reverse transcriptase domain-containing protein n=1 Tax=Rotaria magnacalcarata TaxID=392030 RepID=A0A816X0K9_9BILA|nr:unnamed protein product [Rotaria magnacalcarata]CAF4118091.1 unnamed protein product [Rotaria magnacalcarata]